jgi:hypothetical protein
MVDFVINISEDMEQIAAAGRLSGRRMIPHFWDYDCLVTERRQK